MMIIVKRHIATVAFAVVIAAIAVFVVANSAGAQEGIVPCSGAGDCQVCHIFELINRIINWLFGVGVALAGLAVVYAGALYVTSAGNEGRAGQAKGVLTMTVTGIAIMAVSYLIVLTVLVVLTGGSAGGFLGGDFTFDASMFDVVSCP